MHCVAPRDLGAGACGGENELSVDPRQEQRERADDIGNDVCPGAGFVDAHDGFRDASPATALEDAGLADGACPVAAIAAADPSDRRDGSVPPPKHDWDIHLDDAAEGL